MELAGRDIVLRATALRGQGNFDQAIALIEKNIEKIDSDFHLNAWLEAFRAAVEKGDPNLSQKYAKLVAQEDPNVPSIQAYL